MLLNCNSTKLANFEHFKTCSGGVLGRPFVQRFALCYQTVVLSVLSVPICAVCNL